MPYVIASPCIDVKDAACVAVCPVDCIYTGGRMLHIQPDECIDCGVCLSVCPVAAIFEDTRRRRPRRSSRRSMPSSSIGGDRLGFAGRCRPALCDHTGPSHRGCRRPLVA